MIAFTVGQQTVFLYRFAKSKRGNIGADELEFWRRVARGFLVIDEGQRQMLLALRELTEVEKRRISEGFITGMTYEMFKDDNLRLCVVTRPDRLQPISAVVSGATAV